MARDVAPELSDTLCESCGYRLNGLPPSGNCPECGDPIARSTTESPRRLPAWEDDSITSGAARFRRTAATIVRSPTQFFTTLAIHDDAQRSRRFHFIALTLVTLMNCYTILVHYAITGLIAPPVGWLPSLLLLSIALPLVVFPVWYGMLALVTWLSALEGKYWGYRLPHARVKRVIHYVSIQTAVASALPMLIVTAFAIAIILSRDNAQFMIQYLYVLSGAVVVSALYVFKVYWIAMKAILYANATH